MKRKELTEWTLLLESLYQRFTPETLDRWAKETQWMQRKRKLDASAFLTMLLYQKGNLASDSLHELSQTFEEECHVSISAEAINQRLNERLVSFLKKCIEQFIQTKLSYQLPIEESLQQKCQRIRIIDATVFTLPPNLKKIFPGVYRAELKCQLEYEYLTGQILLADWVAGTENDTSYGQCRLSSIQSGDLFLQDLGYFHIPTFQKIQEEDAYYVSRLRPDSAVYTENPTPRYHVDGRVVKKSLYQKESLAECLGQMERGSLKEWKKIHIGYDYKFPTRLIMYRHTEEQEQKNRDKRRDTRYQTKEHVRKLDGATLIMTNLPDTIPAEKVIELYRLRWQIELLFKGWKSKFPTSFYKQIKEERVRCHVYAHLLLFLITATTTYQARLFLLEKARKEISILKGISTVLRYIRSLFLSIKKDTEVQTELMIRFHKALCRNALKTKGPPTNDPLRLLGVQYS